jgi:hypothetical protein
MGSTLSCGLPDIAAPSSQLPRCAWWRLANNCGSQSADFASAEGGLTSTNHVPSPEQIGGYFDSNPDIAPSIGTSSIRDSCGRHGRGLTGSGNETFPATGPHRLFGGATGFPLWVSRRLSGPCVVSDPTCFCPGFVLNMGALLSQGMWMWQPCKRGLRY